MNCRMIVEGANSPTTPAADEILADKGVLIVPGRDGQRRRRGGLLLRVGAEPAALPLGRARGERAARPDHAQGVPRGVGEGAGGRRCRCGWPPTSSASSAWSRPRGRAATSAEDEGVASGGRPPRRPPHYRNSAASRAALLDGTLHAVVGGSSVGGSRRCLIRAADARTGVQSAAGLLVEVEVPRGLLLEPEPVVLGRLLEEVGRLLEHVLAPPPPRMTPALAAPPRAWALGTWVGSSALATAGASSDSSRGDLVGLGIELGASGVGLGASSGAGSSTAAASSGASLRRRPPSATLGLGSSPSSAGAAGASRRAGPEGLRLLLANLVLARPVLALELEVLVDGVVEHTHRAVSLTSTADRRLQPGGPQATAGSACSTRFLPARLAR